ncbi:MAG: D-xylose transport system substrate-binding protein, partial [Frankiaceae bacterium]|nr:D-xylose transport system substrate-binding protein [Frankiaceae bacterium]
MVAVGISAVFAISLSACSSKSSTTGPAASGGSSSSVSGSGTGSVGVILPDTKTSARWENADKPALTKAFADAGIKADIQNALGDPQKEVSIAQGMIAAKVGVLLFVNLDASSGGQIIKAAHDANIKVIDYDRLTPGGGADFYVSFDNVKVGNLQGQGLLDCLGANASTAKVVELAGSPTDNNATLFSQGANDILKGKVDIINKTAVPGWDNVKGGQIFQQQLTAAGGKVDGVLAANDGLANSVITVLKSKGLQVPVTGQDATVQGLQNILSGDQCMTVWKSASVEAGNAAKLAIAIIKGGDTASL